MTTFNEFVASKALQDRLPFPIDFDLLSVDSDVTTKVGKYEIKLIEELTVLESWFFELIQEHNVIKQREFSLLVNRLADKLIKAMSLKCNRQEAAKLLIQGKDEWLDEFSYLKFCEDNAADLELFNSMFLQSQSTYVSDMMMITLSMILRCDKNWSVGKTASLGRKQLQAIKDVLIKEANGGEISEDEPVEVEPEEDSEGNETQA